MAFPAFYIFQNFQGEDPRTPLIKGLHQLNPQNLSSTTTAAKGKERTRKPSPFKTIYNNFIFRLYRNWKKGGGRWGKIVFVWFVIGLFETLICAITEDKVCDSCIVSSWALLIVLLRLWWPNSNFLCCVITQNGESSRDLLLSVTNRKALAPGGHSPPPPRQSSPLKHLLHYYHFLTTRPAVWCWLGKMVSTLIGYLLTDGLNCLTVKYLAGWHLEQVAQRATLAHLSPMCQGQSAPKPYAAFPPPQWCYTLNLIKIGQLVSEIFKFKSVKF